MSVVIKFKRLRQSAQLPVYQTQHAAGMDLAADVSDTVFVAPHERRAIPTGLTIEIPPGYEGQVRPRSGLARNKGVTVLNSPGTIDSDYRGELQVILVNLGSDSFVIQRGMRIAQLVIAPTEHAELVELTSLDATERDAGGFGSTGNATNIVDKRY